MCPFDKAKTDSVCAIRSRSRWVSLTAQGSSSNRGWTIMGSGEGALAPETGWCRSWGFEELREVLDDDVRAVLLQRGRLPDPIEAHHAAEVARPPRLDSRQRILEHGGLGGLRVQHLRGLEVRVGRGLSLDVLALGDDAVHPHLEQVRDPRGLENVLAVRRRGDDRAPEPRVARRVQVADRALIRFDA